MREAFYEESSVSQKSASEAKLYMLFKVVAIVFGIAAVFIGAFAFTYIPYVLNTVQVDADAQISSAAAKALAIVSYVGSIVFAAGAGVAFWFLKNRFNQSFDYTFVEDELRVSKVYNGRKRKQLHKFRADQILKLGRCSGESFKRTCAGLDKRNIRFLTPNKEPSEGKDFFYLLYSTSIEKAVYILEARTTLIDYIVFAAGRNKWDAH